MMRLRLLCCAALLSGFAATSLFANPTATAPAEGLRENTPAAWAFVGGKIVVSPGRVIDNGTLVIRDGVIVAVGEEVKAPTDARVLDVAGKTLYPGLIDAFSEMSVDTESVKKGSPYWNSHIRPQLSVATQFKADEGLNKKLRSQGITARLVAPNSGIIKGASAVVSTGDDGSSHAILRDNVALHVRLNVSRGEGGRGQYPGSPMGAVALARQAFYDARWYEDAWRAYKANHQVPRPERNDALETLSHYDDGEQLLIVDGQNDLYFLRADRFAREFGLNAVIRGSGDEYRQLEAIRQTGRTVIVPLNFPKAPNVATPEAAMNVTLTRLMDWDIAPENPARLEKAGVAIALTAHGLEDPGKFGSAVRTAIERGLSPEAALRALTTTPAKLLGVENRLGSLETGRVANLLIADGDLFAKETKLLETWVAGRRHVLKESPEYDVRGHWSITLDTANLKDKRAKSLTLKLAGKVEKLEGVAAVGDKEVKLDHLVLRGETLTASLQSNELGVEGIAQISTVLTSVNDAAPTLHGRIAWPDGTHSALVGARTKTEKEAAEIAAKKAEEDKKPVDASSKTESDDADKKQDGSQKKPVDRAASFAVNYPLGEFGVAAIPEQPANVLFKNATVWTSGPAGVMKNADVLISAGKIAAVGKELKTPEGTVVIDCTGKHLSPGIIDCHSHMASDGGINEGTQSVTSEVRIGDFIDPTDITVYRQLAGGVTAASILHGSANTIGGQNQVIKLRWGAGDEAFKMTEAPPGIKFALGENVKQSNWGEGFTSRYPQSRMGVEQVVRDTFEAAKTYQKSWKKWDETHAGLPPRRDLELDAIVEILDGKRWIHCHSYRQDEILALLRTLELYRVKIGSLQHVLEGYKVAREMEKHGATASTFSDWWAYKFEVYDAIPFNGAIMHDAGVVVSFNSDDGEMGRHLNHEAAKAVKYGGVEPAEALKFVTLNPAKQLRIDEYTGSLEVGKQADLVVWSGDPLSCLSVCEQTWVDGRKYFDRSEDLKRRDDVRAMRAALIQKVLASGAEMASESEADPKSTLLWPREDIFCGASRGLRKE